MPRLYHPGLDRTHDAPNDRVARVMRRSGWEDEPSLECDECGFEAKSPSGLAAHGRSHDLETSED